LAEAAAKRLTVTDAFFLRLAYASNRFYTAALKHGNSDMVPYCVNLPTASFHYLSLWWTRMVEEQGGVQHDACHQQILREPYGTAHDSAMRGFVGAWESLKNEYFPPRRKEVSTWDDYRNAVPSYARHLHETAVMLAGAVTLGDALSAEWLATVLTNWYEQMEYRFDVDHAYLPGEQSAHLAHMAESWDAVKASLEIEDGNVLGGVNMVVVFATSLRNYGNDVACVVAYVLAMWGRDCACEESLPAQLVRTFVRGGQTRRAGEQIRAVQGVLTANDLLVAIFRQNYSTGEAGTEYKQMLGGVVSGIAGTRAREMVPGRIYGGLGGHEGLDSLCDGWLVLLAVIVPEHWRPMMAVGTTLRELAAKDNDLFRRCIQDLRVWVDRLRTPEFGNYRAAYECINMPNGNGKSFDEAVIALRQGIENLLTEARQIQDGVVQAAVIDQARLVEISTWASATAFTKETGGFPVSLFETITETTQERDQFALVLRGMEKGRFTRPELAQRALNEEEWFARIMRKHVSVVVLREVLAKLNKTHQVAHGPAAYWTVLKRYGAQMQREHLTGALVVYSLSSPPWLADWTRKYGRNEALVPVDLELSRTAQFEPIDGYLGDIGGIALFQAPVAQGESYLIPLQALKELTFTRFDERRYVQVRADDVEDHADRVDLRLTWQRSMTIERYDAVRISVAPQDQPNTSTPNT